MFQMQKEHQRLNQNALVGAVFVEFEYFVKQK